MSFNHAIYIKQFRFSEFGGPIHERPVEDVAFSVARFIQKGGSFINYYMVRLISFSYCNEEQYLTVCAKPYSLC